MALTKLTLSVDEQTVAWARDLAQQRHVSISRMFAGYIQSLRQSDRRAISAGPLSREAMAVGCRLRRKLPAGFDAKEMLAQALAEKHGVDL